MLSSGIEGESLEGKHEAILVLYLHNSCAILNFCGRR